MEFRRIPASSPDNAEERAQADERAYPVPDVRCTHCVLLLQPHFSDRAGGKRSQRCQGKGEMSSREPLRCALGEEGVPQLGTQVNAQQSDTFAVSKLLDVNVNIASKELPSWLGDGPVGKVLAVQTQQPDFVPPGLYVKGIGCYVCLCLGGGDRRIPGVCEPASPATSEMPKLLRDLVLKK